MNADTRRSFVSKKVLTTVAIQLVITFGLVYMIVMNNTIRQLFLDYYLVLFSIGAIGSIALACTARCIKGHPQDIFLLLLFTVFESILLGGCCMFIEFDVIVTAVLITAGITVALTVYALVTNTDFTGCGPYLFGMLFLLIFVGIFQLFGLFNSSLWGYVGAAVFCLYLIYDVQLCVGSEKFGNEYSVDDYVLAALNIYLDIINLFIYILQILNKDSFVCLNHLDSDQQDFSFDAVLKLEIFPVFQKGIDSVVIFLGKFAV